MSEELQEPTRRLYVTLDAEGRPARWSSSPLEGGLEVDPVDDPRAYYHNGSAFLPVPAGGGPGFKLDPVAGAWVLDTSTPEFRGQVNAERQRRILQGKTFTLTGYATPVPIKGDEETRKNLDTLAIKAQMLIGQGTPGTTTSYRDALNVTHPLTQPQVLDLWAQGGAYMEAIYEASWAIKANPPADGDVTADSLWPA